MSELSYKEQEALDSFRAERDHWKTWVFNTVRANPAISEAELRAELMAQPDPLPDNKFGIKDRAGMLDDYISGTGDYTYMVAMLVTYPLQYILALAPELGKNIMPISEVTYLRLVGSFLWEFDPAPDLTPHPPVRDANKANFIVQESISGTVDGIYVTAIRDFDVQLIDNMWIDTPGAWRIVNG